LQSFKSNLYTLSLNVFKSFANHCNVLHIHYIRQTAIRLTAYFPGQPR